MGQNICPLKIRLHNKQHIRIKNFNQTKPFHDGEQAVI